MDTIAVSDLRNNLADFVSRVGEGLERVVVTVSGKPKAVMLSLEELESLEETAEVLSFPGAYKKIKNGICEAKKGKGVLLQNLKL